MFGISSFTNAPFSSTAGSLYSASAQLSAESELLSFANVLVPSVSASLASDSGLTSSGERIRVATGLLASQTTIASNGVRYAFGAASVDSSSGSSAFAIRYAFGGATVVGESDVSVQTNRFTFPSATFTVVSSLPDVASNVINNIQVPIESATDFTARVNYTARGIVLVGAQSSVIAVVREKWENYASDGEVWNNIPKASDTWVKINNESEIWTKVH